MLMAGSDPGRVGDLDNMKPLPRKGSSHDSFDGLRLYRDDLERLIALLRSADLKVTISDKVVEYDQLDEMQTHQGNSPTQIEIEGKKNGLSLSVSLSKRTWYLYRWGEGASELAREVEALLRARRIIVDRLPLFWMLLSAWIISGISSGASTLAKLNEAAELEFLFKTVRLAGLTASVLSLALIAYWWFRSRVSLQYKHSSSLLSRNRDVAVAIGAAIAGAVAGSVATVILDKC